MTEMINHKNMITVQMKGQDKDRKSGSSIRVIISGGGTGGHIFPAVSIANAIREMKPDADILFVGAEGRMEMQRVPDAGYEIIGLPVAGFDRRHLWKNIAVLVRLLRSQLKARRIVRRFRPQVAVGVGGYASGPTLKAAEMAGIPTLIQEQNSYAGVTNKLLAKKADKICVAYPGMERFFPADKLVMTGNPVRQNLLSSTLTREEAAAQLGLDPLKKTILVLGGSLGARTINRTLMASLQLMAAHPDVQFIWQTGRIYIDEVKDAIGAFAGCPVEGHRTKAIPNLYVADFIRDMACVYRMSDLVVSRAGAGSISEFCLLRKPVVLVPSPNVAEDHQTKNAMALVDREAALYVKDADAPSTLMDTALKAVADPQLLARLGSNIAQLAFPDSAATIAREVLKLAEQSQKHQTR